MGPIVFKWSGQSHPLRKKHSRKESRKEERKKGRKRKKGKGRKKERKKNSRTKVVRKKESSNTLPKGTNFIRNSVRKVRTNIILKNNMLSRSVMFNSLPPHGL